MEYPALCVVFRKQFESAPAPAATEYENVPSEVDGVAHVGPPGTIVSMPTLIPASAAKKLPSAHMVPYAMSPSVLDIRTRKMPDTSIRTMMNIAITEAMPRSSVQ
jgi:hypothetical protein